MSNEKPIPAGKIGLALGGGAARGWAHIGVMRALTEAGIEISCIAGTSIGSIVGAAIALGKLKVLEDFARQLDLRQIFSFLDVVYPRTGLIDGEKVTDFFRDHIENIDIEEIPIPYCAIATNLSTGNECVLNQGDLIEAIRSSISVPGIFTPVKRNDGFLVDGGLVNPVPVNAVRNLGADYVIAVDLNHDVAGNLGPRSAQVGKPPLEEVPDPPHFQKWPLIQELDKRLKELTSTPVEQVRRWLLKDPAPNIFEVLTTSITIMESQITAVNLTMNPPDLLIQPKLGHIRFMDFHKAEAAISEGCRETREKLKHWNGEVN